MEKRLSAGKTAAALISILILAIAQSLALVTGDAAAGFGAPAPAVHLINAVVYTGLALAGLRLLCGKCLKLSLEECRITKLRIKPVWAVSAVLMPLFVCLFLLLVPGKWELHPNLSGVHLADIVTGAVLFTGLAVGIVEEAVFRGVIMTALEKRWNRIAAILILSVVFGLLHIIGNDLNMMSILQLFVGGTAVGVLFSLVTYESGTIWCSALMHGVWNMVMIGGVLNIGTQGSEYAPFNYVLQTDSFLLTGGDFGIETSIIAIIAYVAFSLLAVWLMKRKEKE